MNITNAEVNAAAQIAASKFFSTDHAIDHEDLVSTAAVRILQRNPTNMATAVHVGCEGIIRLIKSGRYRNETATVTASMLKSSNDQDRSSPYCDTGVPTKSQRPSRSVNKKYRQFFRKLLQELGPPLEQFSNFGFLYDCNPELFRGGMFDWVDGNRVTVPWETSMRRLRFLFVGPIEVRHRVLAENHFVVVCDWRQNNDL